jgi:hypothetical protein
MSRSHLYNLPDDQLPPIRDIGGVKVVLLEDAHAWAAQLPITGINRRKKAYDDE